MAEEKGNLFMQLVFMFQTAAMQQMGKVINPLTKKIEKDLSQAKFSVDMLGMIEERTKGNLSDEEKKILDHILFELRMNYVDEVEKEQKVAAEEKVKVKEEKKPPKPKKVRKKRAKSEREKR